jgi:Fe-S-cluster containining protein
MHVLQVVESEPSSPSLNSLLTAIARLKEALEGLPEAESIGYYPMLAAALFGNLPDVHAAYDVCIAEILITERKKITCSKACSACCRHFVSSVEPFELVALDMMVKARESYPDIIVSSYGKTMVYEQILREEGPGEEADDRALYRYFLRGQACPFLERDGTCGVYEWRPMACRMFFAESSPRFCAGKALASPWNRNFQVELPQVAEEALARCSRLLEHLKLPESLFHGMVAVNALFGRYEAPQPPVIHPAGS